MITSRRPVGFSLDPGEQAAWDDEPPDYLHGAASFSEFVWWWQADNDIFYRVRKLDRLSINSRPGLAGAGSRFLGDGRPARPGPYPR